MADEDKTIPLSNVITIDDERIRGHLDRVVRGTVEETLNALLDAEADSCNAGDVTLRVPKLRRQTFETAIIERYRGREASVEEALIEMYLAGVSVRRVEALWGTRVSPSTVSDLNKKIDETIETWRKHSWAGEVHNVSLLVAIAVNGEGYREILGICEGAKEDKAGWSGFLKHLKERGLTGVRLIVSDACMGLAETAAEFFPEALWQRCAGRRSARTESAKETGHYPQHGADQADFGCTPQKFCVLHEHANWTWGASPDFG